MADELLKLKGTYFEYKDKGYEVLGTARMKCPATGKWFFSVIYIPRSTSDQLDQGEYVREINDFVSKFEKVER